MDPRQSPRYIGEVPIPALPDAADYDLGLSNPTYFEAFRIFVPWIDFAQRGAGLPADFQINGPEPVDGDPLAQLDFSRFFGTGGRRAGSRRSPGRRRWTRSADRKSTRLNSSP